MHLYQWLQTIWSIIIIPRFLMLWCQMTGNSNRWKQPVTICSQSHFRFSGFSGNHCCRPLRSAWLVRHNWQPNLTFTTFPGLMTNGIVAEWGAGMWMQGSLSLSPCINFLKQAAHTGKILPARFCTITPLPNFILLSIVLCMWLYFINHWLMSYLDLYSYPLWCKQLHML